MLSKLSLAIGLCLTAALTSVAQEQPGTDSPTGSRPPVTARTEEALKQAEQKRLAEEEQALQRKDELLAFAEQQVPQLRRLLSTLETKRPKQFRTAVLNLARDEERLSNLKQRDPDRFELELKQWKNNQRIQIATAKLTLRGESEESKQELKELLTTRNGLRQQLLQLDLKRARERVARVEDQLQKSVKPSDSELQRQVEQLIVRAKKGAGAKASNSASEASKETKKDKQP